MIKFLNFLLILSQVTLWNIKKIQNLKQMVTFYWLTQVTPWNKKMFFLFHRVALGISKDFRNKKIQKCNFVIIKHFVFFFIDFLRIPYFPLLSLIKSMHFISYNPLWPLLGFLSQQFCYVWFQSWADRKYIGCFYE